MYENKHKNRKAGYPLKKNPPIKQSSPNTAQKSDAQYKQSQFIFAFNIFGNHLKSFYPKQEGVTVE